MARNTENLQLIIGAKDKASPILSNIKSQIIGIGAAYIGWNTAKDIIKESVEAFADYEASLVGIDHLIRTTGRDGIQVYAEMEKQLGGLASKGAIAEGMLKALTTTLNPEQIGQMTSAIRDASVAMGEDFNVQLPLIIKAIKQLNPAILDNIGVTVRLDEVNKRIRDGYYGVGTSVNEVTQQHAIFTEVMQQTAKFAGAEAAQLETMKGSMQLLSTTVGDLAVSFGDLFDEMFSENVRNMADFASRFNTVLEAMASADGVWERFQVLSVGLAAALDAPQSKSDELLITLMEMANSLDRTKKAQEELGGAIEGTADKITKENSAFWEYMASITGQSQQFWFDEYWEQIHSRMPEIHQEMQSEWEELLNSDAELYGQYGDTIEGQTEGMAAQIEDINKDMYRRLSQFREEETERSIAAQKAIMADLNQTFSSGFENLLLTGRFTWEQMALDFERMFARRIAASFADALFGGATGDGGGIISDIIGGIFKGAPGNTGKMITGRADVEFN